MSAALDRWQGRRGEFIYACIRKAHHCKLSAGKRCAGIA
jgi:hypothetical protein